MSAWLENAKPFAIEPNAARRAVVPLDERLQLIGVVDSAALRYAGQRTLDSVADARNDHALPLPRGLGLTTGSPTYPDACERGFLSVCSPTGQLMHRGRGLPARSQSRGRSGLVPVAVGHGGR